MLDDYFTRREILRRHRAGLFGPHLDTYTSMLTDQAYRPDSVRSHCYLFRIFGQWLVRRRMRLVDLDEAVIMEFWRGQRRRYWHVHSVGQKPLQRMLAHLRAQGVVPEPSKPKPSEATALVQRFGEYLEQRRSMQPVTVRAVAGVARDFLESSFGRGRIRLHALGEKDITRFVLGTADRLSPRTTQTRVSYLRTFFRFLLEQGAIDVDLAAAVPSAASWRLAGVPKFQTKEQVEEVLGACDRHTSRGRRDFAILMLLARLGLRACEVTRLELDDIKWRTGELTVRGKGSTTEALPLLREVGEALARYIEKDRPKCDARRVFIRMRAPVVPIAGKGTVTTIVRDAIIRAGLDVPARGAHVLRHSLATNMLRDGASMSEIGTVLRHRSPATTEIYAKVDFASLQRLTQPWPVGNTR